MLTLLLGFLAVSLTVSGFALKRVDNNGNIIGIDSTTRSIVFIDHEHTNLD